MEADLKRMGIYSCRVPHKVYPFYMPRQYSYFCINIVLTFAIIVSVAQVLSIFVKGSSNDWFRSDGSMDGDDGRCSTLCPQYSKASLLYSVSEIDDSAVL